MVLLSEVELSQSEQNLSLFCAERPIPPTALSSATVTSPSTAASLRTEKTAQATVLGSLAPATSPDTTVAPHTIDERGG